MVDKRKLIRIGKISIGTLGGALITGGVPMLLGSADQGYVDLPYHQDKYQGYEVTSKNYHIDMMAEEKKAVVESSPKVLYLNKSEINNLSSVSFETYRLYSEYDDNSRSTKLKKEESSYEYYIDTLSGEEIENIINQFETRDFKEITDNADTDWFNSDIVDNLPVEELNDGNYYYIADLTTNTVNYDKSMTLTEDKDSYVLDFLTTSGAVLGAIVCFFGATICSYIDTMDEPTKEEEKIKTKKK